MRYQLSEKQLEAKTQLILRTVDAHSLLMPFYGYCELSAESVNAFLFGTYHSATDDQTFKTLADWNHLGYRIMRGQTGYRFWEEYASTGQQLPTDQGDLIKVLVSSFENRKIKTLFSESQVIKN